MKKEVGDKKITRFWKNTRYVLLMVIWVFCAVTVAQITIELIMRLFLSAEQLRQPLWAGIELLLAYPLEVLMVVFVPPAVMAKWGARAGKKSAALATREQLGLNDLPTWTDIGLSPVGYIVSTLLAMGLTFIFNLMPWFNSVEEQVSLKEAGFTAGMNSGEKLVAFVVLVILAPIVEEIIFRGWLYGKLRARMGMVTSILIVSVLFGVMHGQWNVGVNVFALSVVCCVLREITGTVYAGILTHMIKNGVAFYILYVLGFSA